MSSCRACGGSALERVLDLGKMPAADHFPMAHMPIGQAETSHLLAMDLCTECGLAQLAEDDTVTEEPRGVEPQALRTQAELAVSEVASAGWLPGTSVREFGSPHGGTWVPLLRRRGFTPVKGDEPADVVLDCFGIMHEPDQAAAFRARAAATAPGGVLLLQFHSLATIVRKAQWNALRHGHFAYYSLQSAIRLLADVGMSAATAWRYDLYGGTILLAAVHGEREPDNRVAELLRLEEGMTDPDRVRALQWAADGHARALHAWLRSERDAGRRVYAYGAASRAVALFHLAGVDSSLIRAVADASTSKQGRRMPGTGVPIISPNQLMIANPDRILLTVPDLMREVSARFPQFNGRWRVDEATAGSSIVGVTGDAVASVDGRVRTYDDFSGSVALQAELHRMVPGGAHTYARGADQYPDNMAPILKRGLGARVWDVDDNEYVEYGMGLRSVTLGHGFRPVVEAVRSVIADGVNFSRPTELEVLAARDFLDMVPTASMVKFAKNGSDATTAAVRLARAATGRDLVAISNQPFFSVDDWFIGTTPMSAGIPEDVTSKTVRFSYNDIESLERVFAEHPDRISCVFMEAATATAEPLPGYLQKVRDLCDRNGAVLVFDEMITGFRWSPHGAQSIYGVTPDLSCWGKAMGNGFPISALAGKQELMELGGLATDRDRVFLLSTTHGPETASLAAFRAVVAEYRSDDPVAKMEAAGRRLADGVNAAANEFGVGAYLEVIGRPSCLVFITRDRDGTPSQAYRTLFLQELISRGVLGQSFVTSAAHSDADIDHTIAAVRGALPLYRAAIEAGTVDGFLRGRPVAPALRRLAEPRQLTVDRATRSVG